MTAQDLDPEKRRAALDLATGGDEAWARGEFALALGKFTEARALVPAPTLALRQGECLEKLGRLIEAAAVFDEAARFPLGANTSEPFRQAVATAGVRMEGLAARIPTLTIEVIGAAASDVSLSVDGVPLPRERWAKPVQADPGPHAVKATAGTRETAEPLVLRAGERARIVLRLPPASPSTPSPAAPPLTESSTPMATARPLRTWAWIGLGTGATFTLVGLGTGLAVLKWRSDLDKDGCVATVCPTHQRGEVGTYNTLRTASVVGFMAGGVGLAAGVILWVLDRPPHRGASHALAPFLGPGSAGVTGSF